MKLSPIKIVLAGVVTLGVLIVGGLIAPAIHSRNEVRGDVTAARVNGEKRVGRLQEQAVKTLDAAGMIEGSPLSARTEDHCAITSHAQGIFDMEWSQRCSVTVVESYERGFITYESQASLDRVLQSYSFTQQASIGRESLAPQDTDQARLHCLSAISSPVGARNTLTYSQTTAHVIPRGADRSLVCEKPEPGQSKRGFLGMKIETKVIKAEDPVIEASPEVVWVQTTFDYYREPAGNRRTVVMAD